MTIAAAAESPHAPGRDATWGESWTFDFARADGYGGFVRVALLPERKVAWYWAYVVGPDIGLVAVRDHEVPLPRRDSDLEVRADALWAEVVCETPLEHWGLGLEAFGLRFDDAEDAAREVGERLAVGLDLEWEVLGPPVGDAGDDAGRYSQAGIVHGELLVGPDRFPFEGCGVRDHSWGDGDAARVPGRHRGGVCFGEALACELVDDDAGVSGWVWRLGEGVDPIDQALVETQRDAGGLPVATRWVLDREMQVECEVIASATVPTAADAQRRRSLCRAQTADGVTGAGWLDWLSA